MPRVMFIENEVAENTGWKAIKNAVESKKLIVMYHLRDNAYQIQTSETLDEKIITAVKRVVEELHPGAKYVE